MRHGTALGGRRFRRADVHAPVERHRIERNDFGVEPPGQFDAHGRFAGGRRPDQKPAVAWKIQGHGVKVGSTPRTLGRSTGRKPRCIFAGSSRPRRPAAAAADCSCPTMSTKANRAQIACRTTAGFGRVHIHWPAKNANCRASKLRRSTTTRRRSGRTRTSCRR